MKRFVNRRVLTALLALAMLIAMTPAAAFASNPTQLTGYGESLAGISVSGVDVQSFTCTQTSFQYAGYTNYKYVYSISLASSVPASAAANISFTKASDASPYCIVSPLPPAYQPGMVAGYASLSYDVSLSNGVGTRTVFLHHDLMNQRGRCDIYEFNFVKASPVNVQLNLSTPDDNLFLAYTGNTNGVDNYSVVSDLPGYAPFSMSLLVEKNPGYENASYTVAGESGAEATQEGTTGGNYWLVIPAGTGPSSVLITSMNAGIAEYYRINLDTPSGGSGTTGDSHIYAALPAPGQFVNEMNGGWGDIYASDGTLKNMYETVSATGISLGYFGGYVVFDLGTDPADPNKGALQNDPNHPNGSDFVLYGNAFVGNSEPGCVQVSYDRLVWYDLAGSLHYKPETKWNYSVKYVNPTPTDNPDGTVGTRVSVPYISEHDGQTGSGVVNINNYHNHSWFPLDKNYFLPRTINGITCAPVDKTGSLPFVERLQNQTLSVNGVTYSNTDTLKFTGVYLGGVTSNTYAQNSFGYFDVNQAGDPMDLAWAVYSSGANAGEPVSSAIMDRGFRYVRVYNGVAKEQPPFGELSPEIRGISLVSDISGTGAATTDLVVKDRNGNLIAHGNMETTNITATSSSYRLNIFSDEADVFVNGTAVNCTSGSAYSVNVSIAAGQTKYVQVITRDGTESPYVTLFKITR